METEQHHKVVEHLMKQNADLITENNELLKKIHRNGVWSFWVRLVWYAIIIGLPFILYFYAIEPYFSTLGSSYDTLNQELQEVPGIKQLNIFLGGAGE